MDNNLGILITASLNTGSSLKSINEGIRTLGKSPHLQKLNLKIDIDQSFIKSITSFIEATKTFNLAIKTQNQVISETVTEVRKLDGSIEKVTSQVLKSGEVIKKTKTVHDENKQSIKKETNEYKAQIKTIEELEEELSGYTLAKTKANKNKYGKETSYTHTYQNDSNPNDKITVRTDKDGKVQNITAVEDYLKQKQALQKQEEALDRAHYQALKTNKEKTEALDKMHYLALQENLRRDEEYVRKQQALIKKIEDARLKFGHIKGKNAELDSIRNSVGQIGNIGNYSASFKNIESDLTKVTTGLKAARRESISFGDAMKTAMTKFPVWMVATTAFYAPLRAIQSGIQYVYDMDKAMTDLYKVTDNTSQEYQKFIKEAQASSNEIGALTLDVIKSTTEWARLGYTLKQAQQLATQTTVYQNVGDIKNAEDASEALIASIKGFGIEVDAQGKNISHVVDVYNEVGNKFAISSAGIGEAVKRSASSLSEAGNTLEESVAMITAANSTVQDPTRVGNALKTVSMRIRGVSEDGEDLSKLVPKLEENFKAIGLTLKKDENTFKSTYEIFSELSEVWGRLSDMKKAEILELVAGKHQGNVIASMLTNWKDAEGALEAGLNSFGSAARENEKHLESIEGKVNQFKNAVGSFWTQSLNSEGLKSIVDFGTQLITLLTRLTDVFGLAGVASFLLTSGLLKFTGAGKSLVGTVSSMFPLFNKLNLYVDQLSVASQRASSTSSMLGVNLNTLKAATIGARIAVVGLQTALSVGLSLAVTGITMLISHLISKHQEQKKIQEEIKQQNDTIANNWINQKDTIADLVNEYSKLHEITKEGTVFSSLEQEQQYKDVVERLSELMPNLVEKIGDKGDKHLKNAEAIKEELKYAEKLADNEQQQLVLDAETNFKGNIKDINEIKKQIDEYQEQIEKGYYTAGGLTTTVHTYTESELNAFKGQVLAAQQQLSTHYNMMRDNINNLARTILEINKVKLSDNVSKQLDELTNNLELKDLDPKKLNENSQLIAKLFTELNNLNASKSEEETARIQKEIYSLASTLGISQTAIDNFIKSLKTQTETTARTVPVYDVFGNKIGELGDISSDAASKFANLTAQFDKDGKLKSYTGSVLYAISNLELFSETMSQAVTDAQLLHDAQSELKDSGSLSVETIKKLNDKYGDFVDVTNLGTEAMLAFIKAQKQKQIDALEADIKSTEQFIKNSKERIKQIEEENKKLLESLAIKVTSGAISDDEAYRQYAGKRRAQDTVEDEQEDAIAQLNLLQQALKDIVNTHNGVDKASKKTKETTKETTDELSKLQKQINAVDEAIKKLQNKYERYAKSSQKYRNAIIEENKLLEKKKNLLKEGINNPSSLLSVKTEYTAREKSTNSSSSSGSSKGVNELLSAASDLQGKFKYRQVPGKFKGTYDEFVKGAISDCSQFVQEMFDEFLDINLPRTAAQQAKQGTSVDKKDLQPGDLVFFNTTGKDNSHVGIYMGDSKFIQMGNSGLKAQNLNSGYWGPKYQGARRIVDGGESYEASSSKSNNASSSAGKIKTYTDKELEEAKNKAIEDSATIDNQLYQNRLKILESFNAEYEIKLDKQDGILKKSQNQQEKYVEGSEKWRSEENKQIDVLLNKRSILHQQAEQIRNFMNQKGIESDEYEATLRQLSETYDEYTKEIGDKRFALVNSQLSEFKDRLEDVDYELELSKAIMSQYVEGSKEYIQEQANQVNLTRKQIEINKEAIRFLEEQLKNEQLSAASKAELTKELRELILSNYNYAQSIKEINESYADEIIENYKRMLEQQRDLELKALDERLEAENKRHESYMDNLDEEQKRFEDYINAQLELMDRQNASDDYESELNKKLKERQAILDRLNVLALDDSMEAKAKKKELQEQLNTKDEEIERFKLERERTLRKEGLQDQLEDRQKYNEKLKNDENKLHDSTVDNIEEEKKKTEQKYKDILENEKYFYDMKQKLLSSDKAVVDQVITELKGKYASFFEFLKSQAFETSQAFENMNYSFRKDADKLDNYPSGSNGSNKPGNTNGNSGSGTSGGNNSNSKDTPAARAAWSTYLINKKNAEDIKKKMEGIKNKSSAEYKSLENSFKYLNSQNNSLRSAYPFFPDRSYSDLKNFNPFSAETGGLTPAWGKGGKFLLAHEKELVLNKTDTANLIKVVDVTRNIINGIRSMDFSKIFSKPSNQETTVNQGVRINNVTINANDKDTADSILKKFTDAVNSSNKLGILKSGG